MKKIIISLIIFLLIILVIISVIILNIKNSDIEDVNEPTNIPMEEQVQPMEMVQNAQEYYNVRAIILGYIYNIINGDSQTLMLQIYPDYIEEFNINQDNILEKTQTILNGKEIEDILNFSIVVDNMYTTEIINNLNVYYAEGYLLDYVEKDKVPFKMVVYMDKINKTQYIVPEEYVEKHNLSEKEKDLNNYNLEIEDIPVTGYNSYSNTNISSNTLVVDYIKRFKEELIFSIDDSYKLLNEEYRNSRFGSIENYKNYIQKNMAKIQRFSPSQFKMEEIEDKLFYTIKDETNDNILILEQTAIMKFGIYLDRYTIDLPEITKSYNSGNDEVKLNINTEKLVEALNNKDYKYLYNKLNTTFKNNKFSDVNQFSSYISNKVFDNNAIEDVSYTKENEIYVCNIKLKNVDDKSKVTDLKVMIRLLEGTNFEISFEI